MNLYKLIKQTFCLVAFAASLLLASSCSEELRQKVPENPDNQEQVGTRTPNRFIAFKIITEDNARTRSTYDADYDDITGKFNKGKEFERALFFATSPEEDEDEIPFYHYAILFNVDGTLKVGPVPLTFDSTVDSPDDDVTVYAKFYDPTVEASPFEKEFNGEVLVVLNSSRDLTTALSTYLFANGNETTALEYIRKYILSKSSLNADDDNFLYLKDFEGNYILDEDKNRYFTMSSSMIFKAGSNVLESAKEGGFTFHDTEENAKKNPTTLYVERLQSKYTVLFKNEDDQLCFLVSQDNLASLIEAADELGEDINSSTYVPVTNLILSPAGVDKNGNIDRESTEKKALRYVANYTRSPGIDNRKDVNEIYTTDWKINILGWDINGIEPQEYLFKKLTPETDYYSGWTLNSYPYRNFWAESVHYEDIIYPDQYREANDVEGGMNDYEKKYKDISSLKYFNFQELSQKNIRKYVPEHTYDVSVLKGKDYTSRAYMRAGSHLIVTAELMISGMEPRNVYERGYAGTDGRITYNGFNLNSKYLMNDIYWAHDAYMNYVIEYLGYWMLTAENNKIFPNNDGVFYVQDKGVYLKSDASHFEIRQAKLKGGDALVWVAPAQTIYFYDKVQDQYKEITAVQYETLAFDHQNYMALCLNEGRMYYAAGTTHNQNGDFSSPATGNYGTVRNNWYNFMVEGFTAPGTPVSVVSQEIIPNVEPEVNGMGVSINLLDWHREYVEVDVSDQQRPK